MTFPLLRSTPETPLVGFLWPAATKTGDLSRTNGVYGALWSSITWYNIVSYCIYIEGEESSPHTWFWPMGNSDPVVVADIPMPRVPTRHVKYLYSPHYNFSCSYLGEAHWKSLSRPVWSAVSSKVRGYYSYHIIWYFISTKVVYYGGGLVHVTQPSIVTRVTLRFEKD